ncbi:MAG TPA: sigma-70 family RNA polymerase sigma factor [Blastocatellia bacterium]|nr:sigma-70 family RNA polymerase sigma factor [Blastocatellia bacterium]
MTEPEDIEDLLTAWSNGDQTALDRLMPYVYDELRKLARNYMRHERPGHTLQTTALVNEAYLRLVKERNLSLQSRSHFLAKAARLMRQILVDHYRGQSRLKRGGDLLQVSLAEASEISQTAVELLALDDALTALARIDERQSQIVEMRFFGGLTIEETAAALGVSHTIVERDWSVTRAWLQRELLRT